MLGDNQPEMGELQPKHVLACLFRLTAVVGQVPGGGCPCCICAQSVVHSTGVSPPPPLRPAVLRLLHLHLDICSAPACVKVEVCVLLPTQPG
jgi:hypothetical protein